MAFPKEIECKNFIKEILPGKKIHVIETKVTNTGTKKYSIHYVLEGYIDNNKIHRIESKSDNLTNDISIMESFVKNYVPHFLETMGFKQS